MSNTGTAIKLIVAFFFRQLESCLTVTRNSTNKVWPLLGKFRTLDH